MVQLVRYLRAIRSKMTRRFIQLRKTTLRLVQRRAVIIWSSAEHHSEGSLLRGFRCWRISKENNENIGWNFSKKEVFEGSEEGSKGEGGGKGFDWERLIQADCVCYLPLKRSSNLKKRIVEWNGLCLGRELWWIVETLLSFCFEVSIRNSSPPFQKGLLWNALFLS